MANTNSKFYTNKEMAKICGVSEASMTNLVKSSELAPVRMGKYGRKYYDSNALKKVKSHYKNKAKPSTNSAKVSTKDDIIKQQQDHIDDLKAQIKTLNEQLVVKDRQIEAQTEQIKQTSVLLSQAHTLTYDERRQFMHDHGTVGRTYAGKIWQYITGSIGLDDFEWGVTLFAETPLMFKKIIAEMRYYEASSVYGEFPYFVVGTHMDNAGL